MESLVNNIFPGRESSATVRPMSPPPQQPDPHRTAWSDYLKYLMRKYEASQIALAAKIGKTQQQMWSQWNGQRPPMLELLAPTAEALGLDAEETRRFTRLAYDAHIPDIVRAEMKALEKESLENSRRITDLSLKFERVEHKAEVMAKQLRTCRQRLIEKGLDPADFIV